MGFGLTRMDREDSALSTGLVHDPMPEYIRLNKFLRNYKQLERHILASETHFVSTLSMGCTEFVRRSNLISMLNLVLPHSIWNRFRYAPLTPTHCVGTMMQTPSLCWGLQTIRWDLCRMKLSLFYKSEVIINWRLSYSRYMFRWRWLNKIFPMNSGPNDRRHNIFSIFCL